MIEQHFDAIIQELLLSPVVLSFKVLRRETGDLDGYIRVKCNLSNGDVLEFAEYSQVRRNRIYIRTYSFHWQTSDGRLVKRWDNVEHHKEIDTFPCHAHLANGEVIASGPMNSGKVLKELEKMMLSSGIE